MLHSSLPPHRAMGACRVSNRAPDNMPMETIRRFIDKQEQEFAEAKRDEEAALTSLTRAIHRQQRADRYLSEYKGWLWDRENGK